MANKYLTTIQSWYDAFISVFRNPSDTLKKIHNGAKQSPIIVILAVVFFVEPFVSFMFSVVDDVVAVKQRFDPSLRPVTEGELTIVNSKINLIQQELVTKTQQETGHKVLNANRVSSHAVVGATPADTVNKNVVPFQQLQDNLNDVQQKLDAQYQKQKSSLTKK